MRTPILPVLAVVALAGAAPAGEPCLSAKALLRMSRCELEEIYRHAEVGSAPTGSTRGTAIFSPGTRVTVPASRLTRVLWQGKAFPDADTMINRVLWGRAVTARVFPTESWLDGRPATAFDYAGTSKLFGDVRDEVREVSPGLWLGLTYVRKGCGVELTNFFVLEAKCRSAPSACEKGPTLGR